MPFQNNWLSVLQHRDSKTYEAHHYNSLQSLTLVSGLHVNDSSTLSWIGKPVRPARGAEFNSLPFQLILMTNRQLTMTDNVTSAPWLGQSTI